MSGGEEIDTDLLGKLNGSAPSVAAAASGDDIDPTLLHQLNSTAPTAPSASAARAPAHHVAPTRFQKSTASEPEMSWSDVASGAVHNAVPSLTGAGKAMLDSVMHPIKTATALGDIGKGGLSQLAGAVGIHQDPAEKAQNEKLISALEGHYKTVYGSVKGFKSALATDPASIAMDAATVIPGVGAATKAAGFAKAASVINKIGSAVDPVANAVRVAKIPARIIAPVVRGASAITTGVPASAMKLATEVGASSDPAVRAAYSKFVTGQGNATEFQQAAQSAVNSIKKDMSNAYLAQKGPMAQTSVSLANAQKAVADAAAKAQMGARTGQVSQKAMDAINEAGSMVMDVANDPARSTLEHVDALKQQLWDLKSLHPDLADNYLNGIYHGVRDDLTASDPAYASLMEKYQAAKQNINDLTKTLGAGKNTAASAMLVKNLRAMKTGTGENLLQQVIAKDPTIGGMLAGQALHPWHAGGRSMIEAMLAAPAAGAVFSHPGVAAAAVPASLIASSPRLAGAINYGAGAAGRMGTKGAPLPKAAYYAGRAEEENEAPESDRVAVPDIDTAKKAVSGVESGGNYDAIGPTVHGGDHAIGKYQVMASNVRKWTQQVLGKSMTPEEFRADHEAQEKVFETVFGSYLAKYGNMRDALSAWHSGVPLDQAIAEGRHDVNMTTKDYVKKAGFKRGGKVGKSHEQLVERLMKMTRAAKKGEAEKTETLLKVPDETVIRALEVAQRAI